MANYIATCRTNYFNVKDLDALVSEFKDHGITLSTWETARGEDDLILAPGGPQQPEGSVALFSYGGWASMDEEAVAMRLGLDDDEEVASKYEDIFQLVAAHLVDDSVAVFMEVGSEKMRYLFGQSVAINSKGEMRTLNIEDILDSAKELLPEGSTATITRPVY